jgi:lipid II:glycine glycyltransferase (peptidoglycan interpeptide bridge formation enzyme)
MIRLAIEKDKDAFNKVSVHPLQSWEWGEFRKHWGNKIVRLVELRNETVVNAVQIIFSKIPHTNFTVGTIIKGPRLTEEIINKVSEIAKEKNAIFIKFEPNLETDEKQTELLVKSGCVKGKRLFTPTTFVIDLNKTEDDILKSFSSKTRYNIRLAQKYGVTVKEDSSDKGFEKYLTLTKETVERQGFYAHTRKYHQLMWENLREGSSPIAHLLTATYQKEIITTWILFSWNGYLYYPYGASTEKYKNVMANNLMMWEAIKFGKRLGLTTFDLWGREEGKGFTKFKEGYNPKVVEFIGTWDLPTSNLYNVYKILDGLRWTVLRLRSKVSFTKPGF